MKLYMGNGIKGDGKEGSNGVGLGVNVQGSDVLGDIVRQKDLGGDGGDAQDLGGVPPPGGATDQRDAIEMWGRRRVGVPIGSGGNGSRGDLPHLGVHQES